jgi:hypothetical protein
LKLSDGSATGTGQTKTRRVYGSTLRLYNSLGKFQIGQDASHMSVVNLDNPNTLFTGDFEKKFQGWWADDAEIIIKQTKPQPLFILSVILLSEVSES